MIFVLRACRLDNSPFPVEKDHFSRLPVRIGRNPLNDFCLKHALVSGFHARIEDVDGKLCVRDLGSKNGIFVTSLDRGVPIRIAPNGVVDLAPHGFRFFIGQLSLQVEVQQGEAPVRESAMLGSVLGNVNMIQDSGSQPGIPVPPWQGPSGALPAHPSMPPGHGSLPPAHTPPPPGMPLSPSGLPPAQQPYPQQHPSGGYPQAPGMPSDLRYPSNPPAGVGNLPALPQGGLPVGGPAAGGRRRSEASTQFFTMGLDSLALQGLRELAGSLIPGRTLDTTGDVARFITKLHDTLEVFCRSFIPLRDGYSQFVSSLDLQRAAMQRSRLQSRAAQTLESATEPDQIALALLDTRDRAFDAPAAVESILADLMLHQVALLDGVMQGVRALLDELSPQNIEASLSERGGFGLLASGHKARWQEFCERFERLSDERRAFSLIFGQQFTQAYRQYWDKQNEGTSDPPLRTGRP
ncbi:MAG: FHA domain-containing protein [Polyangiaceae bacterium]